MNQEKLEKSTTTDGKPPRPGFETSGAPGPIDPKSGQHEAYWVLSEDERAKGFVRPVRTKYQHVGIRPKHPLRDLTLEEQERYSSFNYLRYEAYPEDASGLTGRYWTQAQLNSGCGTVTRMGQALAETYARDPKYYGSTFCCHCQKHFRVGEDGEFIWDDGSNQRVGA
jgi:hypothetical protein